MGGTEYIVIKVGSVIVLGRSKSKCYQGPPEKKIRAVGSVACILEQPHSQAKTTVFTSFLCVNKFANKLAYGSALFLPEGKE